MTTQVTLLNGNGVAFLADANPIGTGIAPTMVLADQNGNKFSLAPGNVAFLVSSDGPKATFRAGGVGLTLYSTAAAVLLEIVGSATKTVRVKRISIWGQVGTKFYTELGLYRAQAASAGSATAANRGHHDTLDTAPTAVINYYTAAAVLGSSAALIGALPMTVAPPTAGLGITPTVWNFSQNQDKAMVLRGTSDVLEIYNTITGLGSGTFGFETEWEEDLS